MLCSCPSNTFHCAARPLLLVCDLQEPAVVSCMQSGGPLLLCCWPGRCSQTAWMHSAAAAAATVRRHLGSTSSSLRFPCSPGSSSNSSRCMVARLLAPRSLPGQEWVRGVTVTIWTWPHQQLLPCACRSRTNSSNSNSRRRRCRRQGLVWLCRCQTCLCPCQLTRLQQLQPCSGARAGTSSSSSQQSAARLCL